MEMLAIIFNHGITKELSLEQKLLRNFGNTTEYVHNP